MPTTEQEVQDLITGLADLTEQRALLEEYVAERCDGELGEIEAIELVISQHKERIDSIRLSMHEQEEEAHEDLITVARLIEAAVQSIKKACYDLPTDILKVGTTIKAGRFTVGVSRATIRNEYRSEALLDAHPELEEVYIDGDPIVGRTIDGDVLDRAIAEGLFDEQDAKKFRIINKIRNSQVRIKEAVDAQSQ